MVEDFNAAPVQRGPKLPIVIPVSLHSCLTGLVFSLLITRLPVDATVMIGILVVVAATVNKGVLLITFAETLRKEEVLYG